MSLDQFALRLSEASLRIEQCLPLFGCLNGGDAPVDALEDFASEIDDEDLARLWPDLVDLLPTNADSDELIEALVESGKRGWLVQVATPVMRPDAIASSFSWGIYGTHWLYAESMEDIVAQAEAWAADCRRSERAKAGLPPMEGA